MDAGFVVEASAAGTGGFDSDGGELAAEVGRDPAFALPPDGDAYACRPEGILSPAGIGSVVGTSVAATCAFQPVGEPNGGVVFVG